MDFNALKASTAQLVNDVETTTEVIVTLQKSNLKLSHSAVRLLNINTGDNVWLAFEDPTTPLLVIGTENGNKLKAGRLVACSGKYNTTLFNLGTDFNLTKKEDGVFYLVERVSVEEVYSTTLEEA